MRWPGIRDGLRARQESEKRQADAAQAEEKRAAEARVRKQQEDRAREERVRNLEQSRWKYDGDIFELSREIRKLVADLKRLKEEDEEDVRKEKRRNGWWAYVTSPIYSQEKETDEQNRERKNARLQRNAARTIKGSALAEKEARLRTMQDLLQGLNIRIEGERRKAVEEKERAEKAERLRKLKMEQEARDRAMREAREKMAKRQREQAEQAAKMAREAKAAQEAREAQERVRTAAAASERRRREAEARAESVRRAEEAAKKARNTNHRSGRATQSTCRHDGWWPKVEGRQLCGKCDTFQNRFLLQCPGCKMVACASCQKSLRGGGTWKSNHGGEGGGAGRRQGFGFPDGYEREDIHFNEYFCDYD